MFNDKQFISLNLGSHRFFLGGLSIFDVGLLPDPVASSQHANSIEMRELFPTTHATSPAASAQHARSIESRSNTKGDDDLDYDPAPFKVHTLMGDDSDAETFGPMLLAFVLLIMPIGILLIWLPRMFVMSLPEADGLLSFARAVLYFVATCAGITLAVAHGCYWILRIRGELVSRVDDESVSRWRKVGCVHWVTTWRLQHFDGIYTHEIPDGSPRIRQSKYQIFLVRRGPMWRVSRLLCLSADCADATRTTSRWLSRKAGVPITDQPWVASDHGKPK